ncbi:sentrin-specific protease 8 [Anoplolepis gracilipes]|uniref:sentrin-specific protease 8 n=1 Tax=Anoplolepis gracilipes TaxID=354296 RepID=UPI003BA3D96A
MHLPELSKDLQADVMVNLEEDNNIVLNYHNYVVRASDAALLERNDTWLNDIVIGFYFEYLDQQYKKDNKKQLLFIDPAVTQLLKMQECPSQYDIFLEPIEAASYDFIFFPLNDCEGNEPGGSHWSLLIYSRNDEICYHYDSSSCINRFIAEKFARNIIKYFLDKQERRYIEMDCPQQNNGYDCGLYVLCLADIISKNILNGLKIWDCNYSIVTEMVSKKRLDLLGLIQDLRNIYNDE